MRIKYLFISRSELLYLIPWRLHQIALFKIFDVDLKCLERWWINRYKRQTAVIVNYDLGAVEMDFTSRWKKSPVKAYGSKLFDCGIGVHFVASCADDKC